MKKKAFTCTHMAAQLQFASLYLQKLEDFRNNILVSDETKVSKLCTSHQLPSQWWRGDVLQLQDLCIMQSRQPRAPPVPKQSSVKCEAQRRPSNRAKISNAAANLQQNAEKEKTHGAAMVRSNSRPQPD